MKKRNARPPSKTFRFRLGHGAQADVWFRETQTLFNQVAAFYFEVVDAHPAVLEHSDQAALTLLERLTHSTRKNPTPLMPLAEAVPGDIPAMFRRAAIHASLGSARSFHANLIRWRQQKERAEAESRAKGKRFAFLSRPPVPPRQWNKSTVLYGGMWKEFNGHTVLLKVWTGRSWAWVKFQISGRALPKGWEPGSPQLVQQRRRWTLHVPLTRERFTFPAKVEAQLADRKSARLCAVDLNINDALAACTIQSADGTVVATRFIRGGRSLQGRRKRALGRVAVKRSQTGVIGQDETDNVKRFRYLRAIDNDTAHRVSRRILEFALMYGATIIVFEHLGHFQPHKGRYSARGNEKRSYWLRGKIARFTQYKAWEYRLVTCRVNPRDTSRRCAECGQPVARYHGGEAPVKYQPGAPLFFCPHCLRRGHADRNASINIGHKLIGRTLFQKPSAKSEGVSLSHGISDRRSQALRIREQGKPQFEARPSSNGARDRVGTARARRDEDPSRRIPRPLRPQWSGGDAARTPSAAYAGVAEEAPPL